MTGAAVAIDASGDPRRGSGSIGRVVFTETQIARRVAELGKEITEAYPDGDLVVIGLLKGSFIFVGDLVRQIQRPLQLDFTIASSYNDSTVSSGTVRLLYEPEMELKGKNVLLVEDIVESGNTLNQLVGNLSKRGPRSLETCALLHRRGAPELRRDARFVGFDAPEGFLVGYGLDYAENFRHLPYIASLQ